MQDSCTEIQLLLKEYLNNKLGQIQREQVERHLPVCKQCRREFELEQELVTRFASLPQRKCSPVLTNRLQAISSRKDITLPERRKGPLRQQGWRAAVALAAAALLLIVFWPQTTPEIGFIPESPDLEQAQIAGQLRWSLGLTANYLLEARELSRDVFSNENLYQIINNAVATGATSTFLKLQQQRNGG
ncbi:MAG: zf-HC2 domain-containing protein [Candidatus Delongbacteria bacterium]|nr:zf-HC2 domain-containing protein [Candidatus Delongbacteria bacterium]